MLLLRCKPEAISPDMFVFRQFRTRRKTPAFSAHDVEVVMNQAVGLDQGPHPVTKEVLIDPAPLGFMILVVLDRLIA